MKYIEFRDKVQRYLNKYGQIQGYASQQERMARFPCNDIIKKIQTPYKLSLSKADWCGYFYELHANIPLETIGTWHDVVIGEFTDETGTIKKQVIQLRLKGIEKYGNEEFTRAVRMVAMDSASKSAEKNLEEYKRLSTMANDFHKKANESFLIHGDISLSLMPPEEVDRLVKEIHTDEERRAAQRVIEKQMVNNAPEAPVIVHPNGEAMFGLSSGCTRKSWIKFTEGQEWTVKHFSGNIWSVERHEILLYMTTRDVMYYFGNFLKGEN